MKNAMFFKVGKDKARRGDYTCVTMKLTSREMRQADYIGI